MSREGAAVHLPIFALAAPWLQDGRIGQDHACPTLEGFPSRDVAERGRLRVNASLHADQPRQRAYPVVTQTDAPRWLPCSCRWVWRSQASFSEPALLDGAPGDQLQALEAKDLQLISLGASLLFGDALLKILVLDLKLAKAGKVDVHCGSSGDINAGTRSTIPEVTDARSCAL